LTTLPLAFPTTYVVPSWVMGMRARRAASDSLQYLALRER
jgi:hypothetical protein